MKSVFPQSQDNWLFGNLRGAPHQWGRFRRKLAKTPPPVSNTTPNPKEPDNLRNFNAMARGMINKKQTLR